MRFPYIYSLSTVNIIYHGNCDYKFNQQCTGFSGESGVGKSIIADLLQLIFIGESNYQSSTHAKGSRPLNTLIQRGSQPDSRSGRGYAFINIQVAVSEFIVIGFGLENVTQVCTPFIVQQGESFQGQLRSITRPLSYSAFISEENVIPSSELGHHLLLSQQVISKTFTQRTADYHRILFANGLVPLDIRKPSLLKDYAQIIRSFSRSGELDKNPDHLESFLFGNEIRDQIWDSYEQLTLSIGRDKTEYDKNVSRIRNVRRKIIGFRELDILSDLAKSTRWLYQTNKLEQAKKYCSEVKFALNQINKNSEELQLDYFHLFEQKAVRSLNLLHNQVIEANKIKLL